MRVATTTPADRARHTPTTRTDMARWTPIVRVRGRSMQPTLDDGRWLLTRPAGRRVHVGDIVVFTRESGQRCVKRVAAGPGDLVDVEAGRLHVGRRSSSDGQPRLCGARVERWRVPAGHYFVIGDNHEVSNDSRVWNEPFVPVSRISGVAL